MRPAYRLVAVIVALAGSLVLFAGFAAANQPASPELRASDSRLSGPGVDISVVIPSGWHQIASERPAQFLQMVYPDTCSVGLECASAIARTGSGPASSPDTVAVAVEQSAIGEPGVRDVAIRSQGPIQIASRPGYQVRFTFSNVYAKFRAEAAAVESGPAVSGVGRMSLVFVAVSDLPGAPAEDIIDQIVSSVQLPP
jgi:hypothetical protein